MKSILIWIMLIVTTERVTEILVDSAIFEPIREAIKKWAFPSDAPPPDTIFQRFKVWLTKLSTCGYCMSVWVGGLFGIFAERIFDNIFVNWFIASLFIHGISNLWHVAYQLLKKGRVDTHDFMVKVDLTKSEPIVETEQESHEQEDSEIDYVI